MALVTSNPGRKNIILANLTLLFLLQNYNQVHILCQLSGSTAGSANLLEQQQYQHHEVGLYKHENQKTVLSSHINTTTTKQNNHSNYTDLSLDQTTQPPLHNEQKHGNHTVNSNATSIFSDPFLHQMLSNEKKQRLQLSARHQQKFMSQKSYIHNIFPPSSLYHSECGRHSAIVLNKKWAYIHIWKSGGSTIEKQTGRGQKRLNDAQIQNRHWMSLVRDPIDHFLSGWAECGIRNLNRRRLPKRKWKESEFDGRIREHLNVTRTMASSLKFLSSTPRRLSCTRHSFPQANFLLNEHGQVDDKLKVIGDLHEIVDVLKLLGFAYNAKIGKARTAAGDALKRKFFQVRKDLLSNETLWEICNFVAIDYYLFDFQPPEVCKSMFPGQH